MTNEKAIEIIQKERNHCATHNQDTGKDEEYHKEMQDLVDAFGLAIHVLETGEIYMTAEDYNLFLEGYKQGKKDFARPHGHWISANGTYYCSCCKHYAYESQKFDFCQDCGADMRSKENDNKI